MVSWSRYPTTTAVHAGLSAGDLSELPPARRAYTVAGAIIGASARPDRCAIS
jgi:hypothetical protein